VLAGAIVMPDLSSSPAAGGQLGRVGPGQFSKVAWATVEYPRSLGCGTGSTPSATGVIFGVDVEQVRYLKAAKGPRLAIVLVRCVSGSSTASALYVFDGVNAKGRPHLRDVLLEPPGAGSGTTWYATQFTMVRNVITMIAKGVTRSAPLCCPDETALMRWTWNGSDFQRHVTTRPYQPPISTVPTVPSSVADCAAPQLVAQFRGSQGAAGNWTSSLLIANTGAAPCALRSGVTLELLDGQGASRSASHAVSPPIELSPHSSLPPLNQEPATGETLAIVVFAAPTVPDAVEALGGRGETCPEPLFEAQSARITFAGVPPLIVNNLTTPEPAPSGSVPPMCGPQLFVWEVASLSASS
jgi:hypothetical protein